MFFLNLVKSTIDVHLSQLLPRHALNKLAKKKLIKTIQHAYNNVPYYKNAYDQKGIDINAFKSPEDLKNLPFITKDDVRNAFPDKIVANNIQMDQCHYSATTGSTGRSLPFVYSLPTFAYYLATNLRVYTMIGYKPWYKCSYIKYTPMDPCNIGPFFTFDHIPSVLPVDKQILMLKKNKPDFIDGYASIIYEMAKRLTPEELRIIRPKIILLNSELSTQHERDFISKVFNCPVYDEYSTEETWMIASLCKKGNYHLFSDNVWVEILDENGNEVPLGTPGEIVLTTLRSPAMPFIRYRIGDIGVLSSETCSCGSPFPVLKSFEGRSDDLFILPDGKTISSLKILNIFTMHINKYLHLMEEFRVIQHTPFYVEIELVKGRAYNEQQFDEVLSALSNLLGKNVTLNVVPVDAIETKGGIKRKAIESKVQLSDITNTQQVLQTA